MTPNDIATSISGLGPVEGGNINASTNFTYSFVPGSGQSMDDSSTWD